MPNIMVMIGPMRSLAANRLKILKENAKKFKQKAQRTIQNCSPGMIPFTVKEKQTLMKIAG